MLESKMNKPRLVISSIEVISIIADTTYSPDDLIWDDKVEDENVDNLVRLI
ncbi:hypothetical protein YC2023_058983 [Brassica napus]